MQLNKKTTREPDYPEPVARVEEPEGSADESYYTDVPPTATRTRSGVEGGEARTGPRGQSVVDAHSTFDGKYETDQDLRVEGTVSGQIICRGELTVERDATANAKIEARDAVLRGRVDGEVFCSGRLTLASSAVVTGTLKAATLVVEEGATLRGSVETTQDAPVPLPRVTRNGSNGANGKNEEDGGRDSGVSSLPSRSSGRNREVPSFALVSSDDRASLERN